MVLSFVEIWDFKFDLVSRGKFEVNEERLLVICYLKIYLKNYFIISYIRIKFRFKLSRLGGLKQREHSKN